MREKHCSQNAKLSCRQSVLQPAQKGMNVFQDIIYKVTESINLVLDLGKLMDPEQLGNHFYDIA